MKKHYFPGRQLSALERKEIIGGYVGGGGSGSCPGNGSQQYRHACTDNDGGETGQTVCCTGVSGNEMQNGVHCVILPYMTDLYVYC